MEIPYDSIQKQVRKVMEETFGFSDFLPDQEKSVQAVLDGNLNVLVSMATNSGKSLCFQLPSAFQRDGIVLVFTPNLSLMECQKQYLNKMSLRAKSIDSTEPSPTRRREIRNMLEDRDTIVKFFYICPEMAANDFYIGFLNELLDNDVFSHVVVDEAHCLTDKQNYRESYSVLKEIREKHPSVPWIALTTASLETLQEIQDLLGMKEPMIVQSSSVKSNIFYDAICIDDKALVEDIDFLDIIKRFAPDYKTLKPNELPSGIIYCKSGEEVEAVLGALEKMEIPATSFYGSMDVRPRFENYDSWTSDKVPVMVATTESFGLGIFKPGVKFVIHTSAPKNLRAYYQESGRAGAAGDRAISRVYYKKNQLRNNPEMARFLRSGECYRKQLAKFFKETIDACGNECSNCVKSSEASGSPAKKQKTE